MADAPSPSDRPAPVPRPVVIVCPYCGALSANTSRCEHCRGLMDPLSRQASQNAMGAWFIRDELAPFRPGCSYETLRGLISRGRLGRDDVLRGPTTRQFWTRATSVPGVAHLLGECHACHCAVEPTDQRCHGCGASFVHEGARQVLGLAPVRLLPGHASPELIAQSMVESLRRVEPPPAGPARPQAPAPAAPSKPSTVAPTPGAPAAGAKSKRTSLTRVVLYLFVLALVLVGLAVGTIWAVAPGEVRGLFERLGAAGGAGWIGL